jgi:hypothetical protein
MTFPGMCIDEHCRVATMRSAHGTVSFISITPAREVLHFCFRTDGRQTRSYPERGFWEGPNGGFRTVYRHLEAEMALGECIIANALTEPQSPAFP